MVQALILAAGRGSRMGSLTLNQPKCFIEISGKRLLEWQIEALKKAGIDKIHIVTGYLSNLIECLGCNCIHNENWNKSDMVESLFQAKELLDQDETIVSYSDIVYHHEIIEKLKVSRYDIALIYDLLWEKLWSKRFQNPLIDAETFKISDYIVHEIGKRAHSLHCIEGQFIGLFKFSKTGWTIVSEFLDSLDPTERKNMQTTKLFQKLIDANHAPYGIPIGGKWCEIDTCEDLELYKTLITNKEQFDHDWRN